MNIHFKVRVGIGNIEGVFLTGSSTMLGKYDPDKALQMQYAGTNSAGETIWEAKIQVDLLKERILRYKYFLKDTNGLITFEVGGGRRLALNSATAKIETIDHWQEYTEEAPFLTDPFSHVFYGASCSPYTQTHRKNHELIIRAVVPNVPKDCQIVLTGEGKRLGSWKAEKSIKMARLKGSKWIAALSAEGCEGQVWKYKLAMVNKNTGEFVPETLPYGKERELEIPAIGKNETFIKEHSQVRFPPVMRKFAGCAIPLFSLRSENSGGCGSIEDMKLLIDWAEKTGIKVLEILPVNDSTKTFSGKDSSPYECITSLGINPLYLSLSSIGHLADASKEKDACREMKSLNHRADVDYEDLYYFKKKYLEELFKEKGKTDAAHPDFYKFLNEHKDWIYGYALFCALRDIHKSPDFNSWGIFKIYSEDLAIALGNRTLTKTFAAAHSVLGKLEWHLVQQIHFRTQFHIWLQFHSFRQLNEVILYAHGKGIALKGELQMKIVPHSVDCWKFPQLFSGEKDGYAVFNWQAMQQENFSWWKKRVRIMSWYLDIYTIGEETVCSKEELPIYNKMIPQLLAVSNMMAWADGWESLRLLPKYYEQTAHATESTHTSQSIHPEQCIQSTSALQCTHSGQKRIPYLSSIYTSGVQGQTMRVWLGERNKTIFHTSQDKKQTYYDATVEECTAELKKTLEKDSMFAMIPLQDWLSIDPKIRSRFPYTERINNPDAKEQIWKYRMHITLENLLNAESLNKTILQLIANSNR